MALERDIRILASLLANHAVFFAVNDDKARVCMGMVAVEKQVAAVAHVEYRVILPDHD